MSSPPDVPADTVQRTFLNVGSGPKSNTFLPPWLQTPDWTQVRLDIEPAVQPDILASATDMRNVADHSFDAVWAANIVEHLHAHEVPSALREFARVIKPDGLVQVIVPDLQYVARLIVDGKLEDTAYMSNAGPITPLDMLYGLRSAIAEGLSYMAHKTGFINTTLERAMRGAGFSHVAVCHVNWDLLALASTGTSLDRVYRPPIMRQLMQLPPS
jgi:SAM-dependent methyltransferase